MKTNKLKFVLLANAAFSTLSGLSLLFFHNAIGAWMGIAMPKVLLLIGGGLLLFALTLVGTALQNDISPKKVQAIIWQDWIWVAGSSLIVLTQAFGLTTVGYVAIGVVAVIVADFAILQKRYLH